MTAAYAAPRPLPIKINPVGISPLQEFLIVPCLLKFYPVGILTSMVVSWLPPYGPRMPHRGTGLTSDASSLHWRHQG